MTWKRQSYWSSHGKTTWTRCSHCGACEYDSIIAAGRSKCRCGAWWRKAPTQAWKSGHDHSGGGHAWSCDPGLVDLAAELRGILAAATQAGHEGLASKLGEGRLGELLRVVPEPRQDSDERKHKEAAAKVEKLNLARKTTGDKMAKLREQLDTLEQQARNQDQELAEARAEVLRLATLVGTARPADDCKGKVKDDSLATAAYEDLDVRMENAKREMEELAAEQGKRRKKGAAGAPQLDPAAAAAAAAAAAEQAKAAAATVRKAKG